jgi:hypothetical protein
MASADEPSKKRKPITFLLEPELWTWYDQLPKKSRGHAINQMIFLGREHVPGEVDMNIINAFMEEILGEVNMMALDMAVVKGALAQVFEKLNMTGEESPESLG